MIQMVDSGRDVYERTHLPISVSQFVNAQGERVSKQGRSVSQLFRRTVCGRVVAANRAPSVLHRASPEALFAFGTFQVDEQRMDNRCRDCQRIVQTGR